MERQRVISISVTNDLNYDQRMRRHAGILSEAGFDVVLTGRKKNNSSELEDLPFTQKRLNCWFTKGKLFYLEYNIRLLFHLLFIKADIYLAVDLDTLLPNLIAAKLKGKILVFDAHEHFTEVPEVTGRYLTKKIWEFVAEKAIPEADLCYTVGPELAELFTQTYGVRFHCILNVPYLTGSSQENTTQNRVLFYQGALNEGRGLEQIIEAMLQIDANLLIAGEGDLSSELRDLAERLNLNEKVQFLGWVSPDKLCELTLQATIGINLLQPAGLSYQYSLANKFFDYIHARIPQICADFIEYRKINSEYKVAELSSCQIQSIVNSVNRLLENRDYYNLLKTNCTNAAKVFNLQIESRKLINLYLAL